MATFLVGLGVGLLGGLLAPYGWRKLTSLLGG